MRRRVKPICIAICMFAMIIFMAACTGQNDTDPNGDKDVPFAQKEPADLSGYEGMNDYGGDSRLIETDVAETIKLIKEKNSFVVFFSYEDCPYCNLIIPYVNEAAEKAGRYVGYIDTRKDPSWESNMDIEGYDQVVEYFGEYLDKDEDGKKHLYTPDIYFIKDGKIVEHHDGVTEGADDPDQPLTSDQKKKLRKDLAAEFAALD